MQARGMLVADFLQHHPAADLGLGERDQLRFFDLSGGRRNRRTVGVVARLTQGVRHPLDQLLGDGMLEALRFDMDVAPVVPEPAGEIRFEDAVATNHLECRATTLRGELDAAIRHVLDQSRFGQAFHHATDRRRSDSEHFGDIAGCGEPALTRQVENGLEIVFYGPRECRRRLRRTDRAQGTLQVNALSTRQCISLD